ncbi:MAG: CpXC domain-containing protein [Aggregatilineales bacterium]
MPALTPISVTCSACGQPFTAQIRTMIDAVEDPQGKVLLLGGRLNTAPCPNCGTQNAIAASLLYHDPEKELLVAHIPMELGVNKDQQEKIIGNMMNALPKENFKAYMFSPKRALTMQNLIEQILEAEGVTKEMMEQQKQRVQLVQDFVSAPDTQIEAMVKTHDAEIDEQFFQMMVMFIQRMMEDGRMDVAQRIAHIQNQIAELSTTGKKLLAEQEEQERAIEEVTHELEALAEDAGREEFMELTLRYADDDQKLQALVGMVRPVFDYDFLQDLSVKIGQAPADERDFLTGLRDRIVQLTALIDQQQQAAMQNAAGFLQALLNHPNPEQMLQENPQMIDDTLMAVISANIQHAEQTKDIAASSKLKSIYDLIVRMLQTTMQPELIFVNELLSTATDDEARKLIAERAPEFGNDLLDVMDAVERVLEGQGEQAMQDRLSILRKEVVHVLA